MKYFIPLLIFSILTAFLVKGLHKDPHILSSVLIGKPVPVFSSSSLLHEEKIFTDKKFLGHVSLLNVWATWCIACRYEHPILIDIARAYAITIYGLNYKDDYQAALNWLKKYGNPYQDIIFDPQGKIAIDFGVYGTPETFVIDAAGIIRYKYVGVINESVWENKIQPQVKQWEKRLQ